MRFIKLLILCWIFVGNVCVWAKSFKAVPASGVLVLKGNKTTLAELSQLLNKSNAVTVTGNSLKLAHLLMSEVDKNSKISMSPLFFENADKSYWKIALRNFAPSGKNEAKLTENLIKQFNSVSGIKASADYWMLPTSTDTYFATSNSWGQVFADQWGLTTVDVAANWGTTTGSGVTVGVIDTGVDYDHEELIGKVFKGYNYVDSTSDPVDTDGHGTHVAGIIAAQYNNTVGIAGVAPDAKIFAIKALSEDGGAMTDVATGIREAADNGCKIINLSLGATIAPEDVPSYMTEAITYAENRGALLIAAAGNDTADAINHSPSNDPRVVSVSAYTQADTLASFSNYGGKISVGAPGGGDSAGDSEPEYSILSLLCTGCAGNFSAGLIVDTSNKYLRLGGTSMAAPFVSGVAALVLQTYSSFTHDQLRQAIQKGHSGVVAFNSSSGYGRINATSALAISAPLVVKISGPDYHFTSSTQTATVTGTVSGTGLTSWSLYYGTGSLPTSWTLITSSASAVTSSTLASWDVTSVTDGIKTLKLVGTKAGLDYEFRRHIWIDSHIFHEPYDVTDSAVTNSSATITWTTNRSASSQIEYGTTSSLGSYTTADATLSTSHSHSITGLSPATIYYYRVISTDAFSVTKSSNISYFLTGDTITTSAASISSDGVVSVSTSSSYSYSTLSFESFHLSSFLRLQLKDSLGNHLYYGPINQVSPTEYSISLSTAGLTAKPTTAIITSALGSSETISLSLQTLSGGQFSKASSGDSGGGLSCGAIHQTNQHSSPFNFFAFFILFLGVNIGVGRHYKQSRIKNGIPVGDII